jgi:DNA replication licensing factor MCM4
MSDSSGLFVRSSTGLLPRSSAVNNSRRGDIHSDRNSNTPAARRRIFVDESGNVVRDIPEGSDAPSFSNIDPTTSDAQAMGGESTRVIWGTNVSIQDTMSAFKGFLRNFTKKYRMWADGMSEQETQEDETSSSKEYMEMLQNMLTLGITGMNLDIRNLKAYPATLKIWHQVQAYPQEIIPLMDQSIKDIMVELAEDEMRKQRASQSQSTPGQSQNRLIPSSDAPVPSSERSEHTPQPQAAPVVDLSLEVGQKVYKVRPFGIDGTINLRDLNPAGESRQPNGNTAANFCRYGQIDLYQRSCHSYDPNHSRHEGCFLPLSSLQPYRQG